MVEVLPADHYVEAGSGMPVLMMPGAEGSKEFWRHSGFVMDPTPGNARLIDYLLEFGLERGGHCCSYTMPEETTAVIKDWLAEAGLA